MFISLKVQALVIVLPRCASLLSSITRVTARAILPIIEYGPGVYFARMSEHYQTALGARAGPDTPAGVPPDAICWWWASCFDYRYYAARW